MTSTSTRTTRPPRLAVTGFLAVAAVAGGLAAAPAATGQTTVRTTSTSHDVVLRPSGDAAAFAVAGGTSAAAVLDDAVKKPTPVPSGDAITATVHDSSTTVVLGGRIRSGLRPAGARAWFFAGTGESTSLRVEVVSKAGVVLAARTVAPGQRTRWGYVDFKPSSRAALKGLGIRFIAVGGDRAEVRAAYADVSSRTGKGATLRPARDVERFTVVPSGTSSDALDDDGDASYDERLTAASSGRSTTIDLGDVDVSAGTERVVARYHARTGTGVQLRVEALSGGVVRAATTLGAASPEKWRELTVPVTGQRAVDDLQLRFTSIGRGTADVAAASGVVTRPGPSLDQVLDDYAATLQPIRPGQPAPPAPVGDPVRSESEPLPDIDAPSGESRYQCVTTPVEASSNPDKIVSLDADGGKMWLGALLQGDKYAGGPGSLAELPTTGERAPITIWTDLMGSDVTRTIADPDGAKVHQGIADMVREAQQAGVPAPARISYTETSQSTVEEGLIKAGFSVKYAGAAVQGDLKSQRSAQRSSLLVSLTQRSFSVKLVKPNAFSDYFDGRFTLDDFDAMKASGQIAPDNPPVVISTISYGRVLYYSLSSTASQDELEAAVKASYAAGTTGGSIDIDTRLQTILNQAEVKVFAMGGPTAGVENLIRTHKIQDYFAAENTLDRAVPISYQVDNLDGTAASFTETNNYNLRTCEAIPNTAEDVGDVVRISKPQFYMDARSRSEAEMYGSLRIDGREFWLRDRDHAQRIQNHVLTNPTSADPGVDANVRWPVEVTLDERTNPVVRIQGSVNCKGFWGPADDGSNQYDWTYDSRAGVPSYMKVPGGSATCGTELWFQVTKVKDVLEYRP